MCNRHARQRERFVRRSAAATRLNAAGGPLPSASPVGGFPEAYDGTCRGRSYRAGWSRVAPVPRGFAARSRSLARTRTRALAFVTAAILAPRTAKAQPTSPQPEEAAADPPPRDQPVPHPEP